MHHVGLSTVLRLVDALRVRAVKILRLRRRIALHLAHVRWLPILGGLVEVGSCLKLHVGQAVAIDVLRVILCGSGALMGIQDGKLGLLSMTLHATILRAWEDYLMTGSVFG